MWSRRLPDRLQHAGVSGAIDFIAVNHIDMLNVQTHHQVVKTVVYADDGSLLVERTLGPYEFPDVPEQFLVVRA
jgi:hypothetical protein